MVLWGWPCLWVLCWWNTAHSVNLVPIQTRDLVKKSETTETPGKQCIKDRTQDCVWGVSWNLLEARLEQSSDPSPPPRPPRVEARALQPRSSLETEVIGTQAFRGWLGSVIWVGQAGRLHKQSWTWDGWTDCFWRSFSYPLITKTFLEISLKKQCPRLHKNIPKWLQIYACY